MSSGQRDLTRLPPLVESRFYKKTQKPTKVDLIVYLDRRYHAAALNHTNWIETRLLRFDWCSLAHTMCGAR